MSKNPPSPSKSKAANARRTTARLSAVQIVYQMRLNHQNAQQALHEFLATYAGRKMEDISWLAPDENLLNSLVTGVEERWLDVENILHKTIRDGGREKVEALLECILRVGIYELMAHSHTSTGIIIHDYLSVTASFYEGQETRLVNGILDRAARSLREEK